MAESSSKSTTAKSTTAKSSAAKPSTSGSRAGSGSQSAKSGQGSRSGQATKSQNGRTAQAKSGKSAKRTTTTATPSSLRVADLPVGVALNVGDRVNQLVTPWTDRAGAEKKVRAYRRQLESSLKSAEKRGAAARQRARGQVEGLQDSPRLKDLSGRVEKVQAEVSRVLETQSARAQDLVNQVNVPFGAQR